ncbi:Hint domain-containing protein [uncultured Roseobacter sp.]|uniref:Hint domain-containing protein n=1 Tax=uncultured Roseobacter sp. TaxID=114847 RepID=UPI002615562D|nr:Hint domain-containing protein [uncultured Roseobacter sp.]
MPSFFGYTNAIFGSQTTTDGGAAVNYRFAPTGTWRWEGTTTSFVVEEAFESNTVFNGDPTNEFVSDNLQIGGSRAQTVEIDGTDRQVIWDYTFNVTDGTNTWRVGVIDVDLDNSDVIEAGSENGYFLVFPDGLPPEGVDLTSGAIVENDSGTSHAGLGGTVVCFAAGMMIETASGPRPVQDLQTGDMVLTREDGFQPLRWSGHTTVAALGDLAPIIISAGVLGNTTELIVSPQHAILVEDWRAELLYGSSDVLVRAIDLLSHDGVYRRSGGLVTYCHILFDSHHLVRVSDLWSESLYPAEMAMEAMSPEARAEIAALFPNLHAYGPKVARCLRHYEATCL